MPAPAAAARVSLDCSMIPTHIALTRQLWRYELVEVDLAAHRRHSDAVAVAADAGDHPVEEVALGGLLEGAEAQRVRAGRPAARPW